MSFKRKLFQGQSSWNIFGGQKSRPQPQYLNQRLPVTNLLNMKFNENFQSVNFLCGIVSRMKTTFFYTKICFRWFWVTFICFGRRGWGEVGHNDIRALTLSCCWMTTRPSDDVDTIAFSAQVFAACSNVWPSPLTAKSSSSCCNCPWTSARSPRDAPSPNVVSLSQFKRSHDAAFSWASTNWLWSSTCCFSRCSVS